ncbi:hypothetical protein [Amycolatopsis sp. CA-128772]|uniref:hypothetical protein n=1 Tax=Amycolatopsis sp. CA-128772 TaxID=2073159 RepID=UPI001E524BF0|nr:hypothetical protein [Amycolatopsis sp. CA-128772]
MPFRQRAVVLAGLAAVTLVPAPAVAAAVTVNVRNPEGQPTGQGGAPLVTYLAGGSTVCDQPTAPCTGWGQVLPTAVRSGAVIAGYAGSGESSGSCRPSSCRASVS